MTRFQLAELGITVDSITQMLTDNANAWVAQYRNVITGFVIIDQTVGELSALFVRSEYQGEGIGRRLLDIAEQNLFACHDEIHLITDGNSRAADFYLAAG
ncbi:GNAT family N-acetyltransferase [Bartonella sp. LJL80]